MAKRTYTSRTPAGAFPVRDWQNLVRQLRSFDRPAGQAVKRGLRVAAIMVQKTARSWMYRQRRPRTPTAAGAVGRFAGQQGAGIILRGNRYPWATVMEFGSEQAVLWGRKYRNDGSPIRQNQLRSRQFRPWVGNFNTRRPVAKEDGYVFHRAIWEDQERIAETIADNVLVELAKHIGGRIV